MLNVFTRLWLTGVTRQIMSGRFLTGHMKRDVSLNQSTLYRFTLENHANISNLNQIKTIGGFRVVIEKMRKSIMIQYRRCQRFQHAARSCFSGFRCVQCVAPHELGQCPRLANNRLPIQCCLCTTARFNNTNHTWVPVISLGRSTRHFSIISVLSSGRMPILDQPIPAQLWLAICHPISKRTTYLTESMPTLRTIAVPTPSTVTQALPRNGRGSKRKLRTLAFQFQL